MTEQIKLSDIRTVGILTRVKLDQSAVADYIERWENGSEPPEIIVYHDPLHEEFCYWLADGWHRMTAAARMEADVITADVRKGTRRDAIECSIRSNWSHGVRRTNADKKKAVELALDDKTWAEWSNRKLADFCGVSDKFVAEVRHSMTAPTANGSQLNEKTDKPKRVGKDGKKRSAPSKPKTQSPAVAKDGPDSATEGQAVDANAELAAASADEGPDFDPATIEAAPSGPVDIKGLAAPYQVDVRLLNAKRKEWRERAEEPRTGAHIAPIVTRIEYHLKEAAAAISQAEPVEVCSKCDGAGCNTCAHTGFWTRSIRGSRK